ncbi:hypothetical protein SAMN02927903_03210 [Flavobacterium caeni]|uniref:Uncharacterized protein n=2 Tax=Flavobacterium caeni TaxID=490189 RepID=A0A1G5KBW1_9FLAO|nr:hypothetical protein SAMN02927903_03210 [Flavobacterium caeni]
MFFICQIFFGQTSNVQIDQTSFLIGLVGDYDGKMATYDYPNIEIPIVTFHCSENQLSKIFIDSLENFKEVKTKIEIDKSSIYSKELAKFFNKFYTRKIVEDYGFHDTAQNKDYSYYFLILKKDKFKSQIQKLSFLAGTFYRFGKLNTENQIEITTVNSVSHFKACVEFAEELGFKIVSKELADYYAIPSVDKFTFIPSEKFSLFFTELNEAKPLKNECQ